MRSTTLLSTGQYVLAIECALASIASFIVLVAGIFLADKFLGRLSERGICATCGSGGGKSQNKTETMGLYDEKDRVIALADRVIALANSQVIERSDIEVGGKHPDEVKKLLESKHSKETSTQRKLEEFEGKWDAKTISTVKDYCKVVRHLPPGMKSDENSEKGRNEGKRSAGR